MENLASARTAVRVYVALSIATVVVLVCLQVLHPELAGTPAWVRGTIVAATSLLMLRFAGRRSQGTTGPCCDGGSSWWSSSWRSSRSCWSLD